ncbi:DUF7557 family protein [Glycomyces terrestris]|uniref:Uncharacterized protein n=1 Tax=Glycomyces terrestris TaxID=2493553 RepID=A0A426URK3_9ACTN|nr:hypothetical protein [Glycomyces terrestris]RRR95799.1 hypothetical protein EIW28_23175 [Glycomyces terrestris]
MQTTIRIDAAVRDRLETLKQEGESLGDVVERLAEAYNPFAGLGDFLSRPDVAAAMDADYRASLKTIPGELPQ